MYSINKLVVFALPRMILFFASFASYFWLFDKPGTLYSTIIKCLPILSLMLFVFLVRSVNENAYKYKRLIFFGLFFSIFGDILLNIDMFDEGVVFFAVAQMCYIYAHGFSPLKPLIGIVLYCVGGAVLSIFYDKIEDPLVKAGLPIYAMLLLTTAWRAIVKAKDGKNLTKLICALGTVSFAISDCVIGFDRFYSPIPNSLPVIMVTYYFAQFAYSLSIIDEDYISVSKKAK